MSGTLRSRFFAIGSTLALGVALTACGGVMGDEQAGAGQQRSTSSVTGEYSYTLTQVDQGSHTGGQLRSDGTATGTFHYSVNNGATIWNQEATTWNYVVPGALVNICYKITKVIQGVPDVPYNWCWFNDLGVALPITEQPIKTPTPFGELLIRVTSIDG